MFKQARCFSRAVAKVRFRLFIIFRLQLVKIIIHSFLKGEVNCCMGQLLAQQLFRQREEKSTPFSHKMASTVIKTRNDISRSTYDYTYILTQFIETPPTCSLLTNQIDTYDAHDKCKVMTVSNDSIIRLIGKKKPHQVRTTMATW